MRTLISITFIAALLCTSCNNYDGCRQKRQLLNNLKELAASGKTLFGQANPTTISYLRKLKYDNADSGDCKDIVGKNPCFYESDFMWYNQDRGFKDIDVAAMKRAYNRGSVIGYCWHIDGMDSKTFYAHSDSAVTADSCLVKHIVDNTLIDNPYRDWLFNQIDSLVLPVAKQLDCPIVFRPWHEMNGNWFWWGRTFCTPEEYIQLYRITVNHIRRSGADNILFAWSPDKASALQYYPGDDYVDIIGIDIYEPGIMPYSDYNIIGPAICELSAFASEHDKLFAITETGCRNSDNGSPKYPDLHPNFWTQNVLPLTNYAKRSGVAWIMSWYGADWSGDQTKEAYIPYLGCKHPNADVAIDDFRTFCNNPNILLEGDWQSH